ncbi:MAG: right-handed parallel beta-helix repeat-containing protein [bacterium]
MRKFLGFVGVLWVLVLGGVNLGFCEMYIMETKWGSNGSGDGQFSGPWGVAVDTSGNVFVADSGNRRIQRFAPDGTFITKWGSNGSGDGQFSNPRGVAVDTFGNVFVTDYDNNRIQKFAPDGTFITKWGSNGSGDGQFYFPFGVAVDTSGNVFVADTFNHRIQKFAKDGIFITKWGSNGSGDGQFSYPYGVAVDTSGNVFVADCNNNRIQKFAKDGTFITKWGSNGSGDGQFYSPCGVAVDTSGNVFVADSGNRRIQRFAPDGTFIIKWVNNGSEDVQHSYPYGVAVDASGNVFVADTGNCRIQKFNGYSAGRISGKVTSLADNKAINGAMVEVFSGEKIRIATTTDTNGDYCLLIPVGSYTVRVTASGYGIAEQSAMIVEDATATVNASLVAGTLWKGNIISTNTTWTLSKSPYIIGSNTLVEAGVTLTIEPGVMVRFASGCFLRINGSLKAKGTADNRIVFTSDKIPCSPGDWQYLEFTSSSANMNSIISYCEIRNAQHGLYLNGGSPKEVSNSIISNNSNYGIYANNNSTSMVISGNIIRDNNSYGIYAYNSGEITISGNTIERNNNSGIYICGYSLTQISDNYITNNGSYGISQDWGGKLNIYGNTIATHTEAGLRLQNAEVSKNRITGNKAGLQIIDSKVSVVKNTITNNKWGIQAECPPSAASKNNLCQNIEYDFCNNSGSSIPISGNWWGTTASTSINEKIFDYYDNFDKGKVVYVPMENSEVEWWKDLTPPTGKPSTPIDAGTYSTSTTISFSWDKGTADDAETGIGGYRLQIKGGTETIFDAAVGNVLFYTTINATHSFTYHARVKAKNNYEVEADDAYWSDWSNGIMIDTTPPTGKPSTPTDTGSYSTITAISFSWNKGTADDTETGIGGYRLQIEGVNGTETETIFDAAVGNVLSYTIVNTNYSFAYTYRARVKARNGYGVEAEDTYWSDWSNGILIDTTPPTGKPSTPTDAGTYSISTTISFSWGKGAADDTETGIGGYRLQVKGVKGTATEMIFDAVVGDVLSYTTINAAHSFTYYARVKARNGYGAEAEDTYWSYWSNGILIDTTPPTGKPSTPTDAGTYSSSTTISFSWNKGAADDAETGIGSYRLQIKGVRGTATETIFDAGVGNVLSYTTVNATQSLTYYARVKANNGCGVEAEDTYWSDWSNGIMIDTTPPTGKPSPPTDAGTYSTSTTISFSWNKGAADDAETGIGGYRLQIEGVKGTATKMIFDAAIGNVLSYTMVNATHSFTYRARVKARNGYGVEADNDYWSDWSDGITVDTEPPQAATISLPTGETQIKSGKVTLTGKTEPGATLSQITIKDQRGNILLQGKTYSEAIDTEGNINITIDSGELAKNYPLSSQIVIEFTIKDKAGNLITGCSSLIDFAASTGEKFTLYNNLFDPTKNEGVIIKYELTENTEVSIMIYDFRGNLVKSLVDSYQCAGIYTKTWNGRNDNNGIVSSGIYLIQIKAGGFKEIKKVAVVE